jgi:parallel beta-helix repeat protein
MKRIVSRIIISVLLLIGMLAFEFNIQPVAAANADHNANGYDNREDSVSQVMDTSSVSYTIFATRIGLVGNRTANGHVIQDRDHFVALPSTKVLCSNGGHEFEVRVTYKGKSVVAQIWDVGPWNTKDDYWNPSQQREMWNDLPQGTPEAQAAYKDGYNGGKDQFGRTVTNPAGIDLADGTFWDDLGMTDNDWVTVEFLWVPAVSVKDSSPYFTKGSNSGHPERWHTYIYDGTPDGDYNGHTYIWTYVGGMPSNHSEPDCWAEFRPHLSQAGRYDVYACFYADPKNSHTVPHTIYYSGGLITVQVDQYAPEYFTWREVKLGTWNFDAGSSTRIVVTDATGEPYDGTTTINVDTVKLRKASTRTWTVDDDGPADFSKIQEAISSPLVVDGDTIFVYSGTYYENVLVNKTVSLLGENKDTTIVDGTGTEIAMRIEDTENTNISGFTVRNADEWGVDLYRSNRCVISNVRATNNSIGIRLLYADSNIIINNTADLNRNYGIKLSLSSNDNHVIYNYISNQQRGIEVLYYSRNNLITNNSISNSTMQGVFVYETGNNTLLDNDISSNHIGITLFGSSSHSVSGNYIANNGIGIDLFDSSNYNSVSGNDIVDNEIGTRLVRASNNSLFFNNFLNNTEHVNSDGSINVWDDGYPSGGNYWSDYGGVDLHKGPYQNIAGSDGLGDTPYIVDVNNTDQYPFMHQDGWLNSTQLQFNLNPNPAYVGQTDVLLGNLTDRFGNLLNNTKIDLFVNGTFAGNLFTSSSGWFTASSKVSSPATYNITAYYYGLQDYRPSSHTETLTVYVATITIWTDKTVYHVGETMKVYVRVKNGGSALPVRAIITLKLPSGDLYTVLNMTTTLPANYDSGDVLWNTFIIPTASLGNYTWIAELRNPATGALISQSTSAWSLAATAMETPSVEAVLQENPNGSARAIRARPLP